MTNIPEHNSLISARMVADATGISEASIQNFMRDGKIPCVQIGQKRLMTQRQYGHWINELEASAGLPPEPWLALAPTVPVQANEPEADEDTPDEDIPGENLEMVEAADEVAEEAAEEDLF